MTVREFVECVDCGFVTYSAGSQPKPKGRESCPDCGGTEFRFSS